MRYLQLLILLFTLIGANNGFSQNDNLIKHSLQISSNISVPFDYNIRYITNMNCKTIDCIGQRGYDYYNKLGGIISIELQI